MECWCSKGHWQTPRREKSRYGNTHLPVQYITHRWLKVDCVIFHIREGDWRIELPFSLEYKSPEAAVVTRGLSWYNGTRFVPLRGSGSSVTRFVLEISNIQVLTLRV